MKITNQQTGDTLDIPMPDFAELGKYIRERAEQINTAGIVAEPATSEFIRRQSMVVGRIAMEVSTHCGIPIAEATHIVLQVAAISTNNNRIAAESFMADHVNREIDRVTKKHLKPV